MKLLSAWVNFFASHHSIMTANLLRQQLTWQELCILCAGVYVCLTPIVLVDLLGLAKLSNAFGLVLLFQGIGAVAGPPFAGLYGHVFI